MQAAKKSLVKGVENEGVFLRSKILKVHLTKLNSILSKPDVTYGDIKSALRIYKTEILKDS